MNSHEKNHPFTNSQVPFSLKISVQAIANPARVAVGPSPWGACGLGATATAPGTTLVTGWGMT